MPSCPGQQQDNAQSAKHYVEAFLIWSQNVTARSRQNTANFLSLQWRHNERDGVTGVSIVCIIISSGTEQRDHQSSASLTFVRGIHRWPHKGRVTPKMFPFHDVIILGYILMISSHCQHMSVVATVLLCNDVSHWLGTNLPECIICKT